MSLFFTYNEDLSHEQQLLFLIYNVEFKNQYIYEIEIRIRVLLVVYSLTYPLIGEIKFRIKYIFNPSNNFFFCFSRSN